MRKFENSTSTAKATTAPASVPAPESSASTTTATPAPKALALPSEAIGRLTYADIEALFGTPAAERMYITRQVNDDGVPSLKEDISEVRNNLANTLLKRGVKNPEVISAATEGNYGFLLYESTNRPYIRDDVLQAARLENSLNRKRERQVMRGARAFRHDKIDEKTAVFTTAAMAVTTAVKVITTLKKLAK